MSFAASWCYYGKIGRDVVYWSLPMLGRDRSAVRAIEPFYGRSLLPSVHLHTLMTLILFLAGHVQICIRQASTDPVIFWYAAHLTRSKSIWGRRWTAYCVAYGGISVLLWAAFLPPA